MSFPARYDSECVCTLDDIFVDDEITYCKRCEGYAHVECERNCFEETSNQTGPPPQPVLVPDYGWFESLGIAVFDSDDTNADPLSAFGADSVQSNIPPS